MEAHSLLVDNSHFVFVENMNRSAPPFILDCYGLAIFIPSTSQIKAPSFSENITSANYALLQADSESSLVRFPFMRDPRAI